MHRSQRQLGSRRPVGRSRGHFVERGKREHRHFARRREGRQLHAGRPDRHGPRALLLQRRARPSSSCLGRARRRRLGQAPPPPSPRCATQFKDKNVQFLMLDSSLKSKRGKFEGTPGSADLPVLADDLQLVGRALGVTTTGEAFVVDTEDLDRSPITARSTTRSRRRRTRRRISPPRSTRCSPASAVPVAEAAVKGTPIDFPDRKKAAELREDRLRDARSRRSSPTSASSATRRAASVRSR